MSKLGVGTFGYVFVAGFSLLVFSFAFAQETGTTAPIYCPNLSITMQKCDPNRPLSQQRCTDATTQGQVTELQKFLSDYYDLNPDDYITGYFGRLTRDNVRRFQCERMSICSGDESTTGWGVVGSRTRAAIRDACGTQTQPYTPPPPTQPPPVNPPPAQPPPPPATPAPTCTLSVSPTTIQSGGFAALSWTSQHASTRTIDHGIGEVAGAGTHFITSITNTTTYTMTVTGQGGINTCTATLTVTAPPPAQQSCTTPWGTTIAHNTSVTAYQSSFVPAGQTCTSQTRTCTNGTLSGSYQYATCTPQTATCTPEASQTQTLSCPAGQTGSITQTRTSTCPGPTWGAWTTTSNTCTTPPPPPPANVGSCTYKGQTYQEGQSLSLTTVDGFSWTAKCDNSVWVMASGPATAMGSNVCDSYNKTITYADNTYLDFGCTSNPPIKAILGVVPRHGTSPLLVTAQTNNYFCSPYVDVETYTISWGDGSTYKVSCPYMSSTVKNNHTFTSPGSYTISYTSTNGNSNSANIRVDGNTASISKQSQLASALAALESALKAILRLLGQ